MNQFNMSVLASSAGVLGLVKAFNGLIGGLRSVATQSIQVYSHFESMQKGLETFFQSADKGKAKFDELRKFSNETTFGVDELANAFIQLANVGADVDTITQKLTMLGNLSGGDKQKFADLVSIYSKILSVGKAGSEQIQQLAMRGIPINDMLKKIGVTGTATGEQITKVFEEMTKEGGQFYNAMKYINDTIIGKEGFVSDSWREMLNNFAEATGLAEVYKSVLDTVKEAVGHVVDKLYEINNNPTTKIIFQGALVSTLAAIVGIIGGSLLTAISALNKKLAITAMLKTVLDPKTLVIAAALAGVAGLTVAVAGLVKEWENAGDAVKDYNSSLPNGGAESDNKTPIDNMTSQLEQAQREYDIQLKKYLSLIDKKTSLLQSGQGKVGWAFQDEQVADSDKAYLDELDKKIRKIIGPLDAARQKVDELKESLGELQAKKDFENRISEFEKKVSELFDDTSYSKAEKDIDDLAGKINGLQSEFKEFNPYIDDSSKDKVSKIINEWQSKLENMKIKFAVGNQNDWQKELSKILGFSDKQISQLMQTGYTGNNAGAMYGQIQQTMIDRRNQAYGIMGFKPDSETEIQDFTNMFNDIKSKIIDTMRSENFSINDKIFKSLNGQLEDVINKLKEFGISVDSAGNLKKTGITGADVGNEFMGNASGLGGDVGTFLQSFQQTGNVFIALINTVIGALFNVLTSMKDFKGTLSPITELFKKLKPLLSVVIELVKDGEEIMSDVLSPIIGLLNAFAVVLKILNPIVTGIMRFFLTIGGLFTWLTDIMEDLGLITKDTADEEKKKNEDLREAYKTLLSAMKNNEEEYEKRKKELNASDYASKVTGVHDMILTPQGQFSTDPDDYIIATKNPGALNNGESNSSSSNLNMNIIIKNEFGNQAEVSARQIDSETMMIQFSRKIASDYANGSNGWDTAISARAYKQSGRSLAL